MRFSSRLRGTDPRAVANTVACVLCTACGGEEGVAPPDPPEGNEIALLAVVDGLSSPIHLAAPQGDDRLFVAEQGGRIRIVEAGAIRATPFLDIRNRVRSGGEQGLLGLAFDPNYAASGRFYVNFTDNAGDTRIERFVVSADPNVADPNGTLILEQSQPFENHNGGMLQFGPDGMLYVAFGDGGSANDPRGAGQDVATLLGAMIRIDVSGAGPYSVPPDNPFAGGGAGLPEIWAIGLRNPWRFDFDPVANLLFVADVGQGTWEEVTVVEADRPLANFGWNTMEGPDCFRQSNCDRSGLDLPVTWYSNGPDGCAVIGGHVYRGSDIPAVTGHYFYSDLCAGWLRSFRYSDGEAVAATEWPVPNLGGLLSFGEDGRGEMYVLSGSTVWQIVAAN